MKKVALLHYAYPPKIGGVERMMSEQASILAGIGYDVLVLCGTGKDETLGVRVVEIPELQAIRRFDLELQQKIVEQGIVDQDFYTLAATIEKKLETALLDREVLIVHNMLTLIHNLPFVYAFKEYIKKNPHKKVIVWTHDQTFVDNGRVVMEKKGVNLSTEIQKLFLDPLLQATYVVISETFKKLLQQVMQINDLQIKVIPNGINMRKFLEIDEAIWAFIQQKQLLIAYPLILSPVNILERKNLDYCLHVVSELKRNFPLIKYIISGVQSEHRNTGGYLEKLKQQIIDLGLQNVVIFLGDQIGRGLTDAELHDLYDISDIVLYFSTQENFGLPILEAALTKTSIWVSDLEVFHEVGGSSLTYIDTKSHTPSQTGVKLTNFINSNDSIQMQYTARNKYSLEEIIKNQLVPLINN